MESIPIKNNTEKYILSGEHPVLPSIFTGLPTDLPEGVMHSVVTEYGEVFGITREGLKYSTCSNKDILMLLGTCATVVVTPTVQCEEAPDLPEDDELPQTIDVNYNNKRVDPCQT